jgi:hypothetical protein
MNPTEQARVELAKRELARRQATPQQSAERQAPPIEVEVPGIGIVEFPAGTATEVMEGAIKAHLAKSSPTHAQLMDGARRADAAGDGVAAKRFLELAQSRKLGAADNMETAARAVQSFTPQQLEAITRAQKNREMVEGPKGPSTYEELIAKSRELAAAGNMEDATRVAQIAIKRRDAAAAQQAPQTNLFEQSTSGINEGIAGMLGAPVDLMAGAMNMGAKGINALAGTNLPSIENPVGGSGTFRDMLAPTISEVGPQTAAQRYGRRIGQEVGAAAIPGGIMMRGAAAPLALAGTQAASALGAGLAGQTSQEIARGNSTADMIASMLGGMAPIAAGRAMRPSPQAPTLDSLKQRQAAAYGDVDASQARLDPAQRQGLIDHMRGRTDAMDMDEFLHPRANRTMSRMDSLEPSPRIADIEQKRRLVGRDVAGSLDPAEAMIGQGMKGEIDTYMKDLAAGGNLGPDASATLGRLQDGREMTQRIKKSEGVMDAITKAERRAASTGTGGNEVNTTRQNIRAMLDNPKTNRGWSAAERELMEGIVMGTPTQNALRLAGRFSPTSGALSAMGGLASGASFGPLGVLPSVVGYGAKAGAEALTKRQIEKLMQTIRNGGPLAAKAINSTDTRAAIAAMLAQGASAPQ